ncbi:hypothetical protein EVAR_43928_1 [Eumeta japonica]|uniref:Uncharacterized protein n=1 Tax=Eumeta variegata TaxID=151549 RepID=A0A4C1WRJ2_EUMVA|nr:hypothetical protein EVAR_43928_1 [Eumeta japonica]
MFKDKFNDKSSYVYLFEDRCRNSDITEQCSLKDMVTRVEKGILQWFGNLVLRTQSGDIASTRLRKFQYTDHPSIQGPWTPFTFKNPELNVASLPDPKFGANDRLPMSATERLRIMFEKQKLNETDLKIGE